MKILAALFWLLASLQVSAEPSGLVKKLMTTETTMFEMGLLRLSTMLQRNEDLMNYSALYDWDTNQINVSRFVAYYFTKEGGPQIETFCGDGEELGCIAHLKKKLTEETKTLCSLRDGKCFFGVSQNFSREGFTEQNFYDGKNDREAVHVIDDITVAKIAFYGKTYIVNCEKYIKSEEVKCTSKKAKK